MKVGSLVKLPKGRFWWNSKVGVITETRLGRFSDCWGETIEKMECRIDFGEEFIWYWNFNELEELSCG